ncbi:hypothetical protein FRB90_008066 [Tulasnella sp. 427]|nr:hypothetical protein FRB90_008066 [Tulasnella sp. 427]
MQLVMIRPRVALVIFAVGASLLVLLDLQFRSESTLRRLAEKQIGWSSGQVDRSPTEESLTTVTQEAKSWTNLTTALDELMPDPAVTWKGDVMAPYEYPDHYYLGYALDHHCEKNPLVAPELKKDYAFILSKRLSYYYSNPAFLPETWSGVSQSIGMEMVSVAYDDTKGEHVMPEGVRTLGRLSREDFYVMLGSSRAMIGNGNPVLSPSPFDALCIGVPFIHPYDPTRTKTLQPQGWDRFHTGVFQHGALLDLAPPYVYHIPRRNVTALSEALLAAKANPIGRSLPEKYKMASLMQRVKNLVEDTDWEALAWMEGRLPLGDIP